MTEGQLYAALQARYQAPEWALIPQVRNATGFSRVERTADALAISLWPSRGLHLHGFELKGSRSDWLRELKAPEKAEPVAQYCDYWWIVSAPDVVHGDEVPATWGWLECRAKGLTVKKAAPVQDAVPMSRAFLAALLRRAQEVLISREQIDAEVKTAEQKTKKACEATCQEKIDKMKCDHAHVENMIKQFEEASGVKLNAWQSPHRIGEAVRLVLHGEADVRRYRQDLDGLRRQARAAHEALDRILTAFSET